MKRLAVYAAVILATLAGLFVLWQLRIVLGLFVLSLFLAAAVRPIIERLMARGIPQAVAMLLTYLSSLLLVGLLFYFLGNPLIDEAKLLGNRLAYTYETRYPVWVEGSTFQQAVTSRLPPPQEMYELITAQQGTLLAQTILDVGSILTQIGSGIVLVLVLSIYWSVDRAHFERLWLSLVAVERRGKARDIWREIEAGIGRYIRAETVQLLLTGFLLGVGYVVLGVAYPTWLALLGAFARLIPVVGFLFIIIPAFLTGMLSSLQVAVAAAIYSGVTLIAVESFVKPRLNPSRSVFDPIILLLLILPLAEAYGLVGLLLAPIVATALQILVYQAFRRRQLRLEAIYPEAQLSELEERTREVQMIADMDSEPETQSLVNRLAELLQESDQLLQAKERRQQ